MCEQQGQLELQVIVVEFVSEIWGPQEDYVCMEREMGGERANYLGPASTPVCVVMKQNQCMENEMLQRRTMILFRVPFSICEPRQTRKRDRRLSSNVPCAVRD